MSNGPHLYELPGDTATSISGHDPKLSAAQLQKLIGARHEDLDDILDIMPQRPGNLEEVAKVGIDLLGLTHFMTPDTPELWDYLRIIGRAIGAGCARMAPGSGPVIVDFGKGPVEIPRAKPDPGWGFRPADVVRGYHAAMAARDRAALDLLAQAPVELLASVVPWAENRIYIVPHALGLQAFMRQDRQAVGLLTTALQGCSSSELPSEIQDYALLIASPQIELAFRYLDTDEFSAGKGWTPADQIIRAGLTWHRRYWSEIKPDGTPQNGNPAGFVSLGLLAWAALRADAGLPVNIRSDYLPRRIIERQT